MAKKSPTCNPRMSFEIYLIDDRRVYLQTHSGYFYMFSEKEGGLRRISGCSFFDAYEEYRGY